MKMGIYKHALTLSLLTTSALACPSLSRAQEAEDTPPARSDEIVVTAQRRQENLQNVPLSIDVLSEKKLSQQNVAAFDDYAKILPSVSFQSFGPSQSQIFFRGVAAGGDGLHIGPLPTSSLYIDEIPVTTIGGSVDMRIYDISRIEALAGPQGTLFGASSLSGVVRLITNKPDPSKFSGSIDTQLGKYTKGGWDGSIDGYVNLPLNQTVAFRANAFYEKQGGYIDNIPGTRTFTLDDGDPATNLTVNNAALVKNDYNDVETYGGRAALGIELDDNWTVTPQFIYQHQVSNGGFLYDPKMGYLKVTDYLPSVNKDRWWQAALTIQGKISDWDVSYAGGYMERKIDNQADYSYYSVAYDTYANNTGFATYFRNADGSFIDPTENAILKDKYSKFTQELRVSSPSKNAFRLTAGAFMQIQTDRISADFNIKGISAVATNFWIPVFSGGDTVFRTRINRKDRDYAMFAQTEYDLSPTLTAIAGVRGFIAHNTLFGFSGIDSAGNCAVSIPSTNPEVSCLNVDKKAVEAGAIWKGGLRWQATSDVMLYATVSRGYRPGGNNRRPGVNAYSADTLDNFELGWKTRFGPITFNGAAFYEKWKKLQFGLVPLGNNGTTNTYNAGDARIVGVEGNVSARFGGLTLSAAGTYVDAKLTTNLCQVDPITSNIVCVPGTPPAAAAGTRLPVMPRFKGNATARYEFPVGVANGFFQGTVTHQGGTRSFLTDADFAAVGPTKPFTTVDFSAGVSWDKFRLEAFIQNAFESHGILSLNTVCATQICGAYARAYPTKPRFIGLKAGYDF